MSSTIPRLRFARSLALSGVATVFALIACETAGPTAVNAPVPQPEPEVAVVESAAKLDLSAGQKSSPLIIVDGVIADATLDENGSLGRLLHPADIERIEVIKGAAAAQLYGDRARDGVIMITTNGEKRVGGTATYTLSEKRAIEANAVLRAKTVEGRSVTVTPLDREAVAAGRISRTRTETLTQKGAPAVLRKIEEVEAAELRAKQADTVKIAGVITSKPLAANAIAQRAAEVRAKQSADAVIGRDRKPLDAVTVTGVGGQHVKIQENATAVYERGSVIRMRGQGGGSYTYSATRADPIFYVDGVRVDDLEIDDLDPERIESIEVLKGAAATALYGPAAKNGVIHIKTKR